MSRVGFSIQQFFIVESNPSLNAWTITFQPFVNLVLPFGMEVGIRNIAKIGVFLNATVRTKLLHNRVNETRLHTPRGRQH